MSVATQSKREKASTAMNTICVYNTLTKTKEPLETVAPGKVGMYLCGPTVYKEAHIGHMVGPVIFDAIKRYLTYCGYEVTWVVNITDIDDKIIAESRKRNLPMAAIAEEMTQDYLKNLASFGVDQIDRMPRATETMSEIIAFIADLIDKGFAYASSGDVFFDVTRDPEYGKLSNRSADSQQGEGGDAAAKKRSPGDFALWKSAKPGEPSWESPWGPGRPGWHIECSAMSRKLLGETFDIHGGGLDLVFPHHENEIAQSECRHGKPMAKYWMHNGLMRAAPSISFQVQVPEELRNALAKRINEAKKTRSLMIVASASGRKVDFGQEVDRLELEGGALDVKIRLKKDVDISAVDVLAALGVEQLKDQLREVSQSGKVGGRADRQGDGGEEQAGAATKISRSKGAGGLADLVARQGGERLRFFLLRTHYRSTIVFSEEAVAEAGAGLETFYRFFERYQRLTGESFYEIKPIARRSEREIDAGDDAVLRQVKEHRESFLAKMDDDFNTGAAMSDLFELVRTLNKQAQAIEDASHPSEEQLASFKRGAATLRELSAIFGLFREPPQLPAKGESELTGKLLDLLVELRGFARGKKDFAMADRIRDGLASLGVTLEDRKDGTQWRIE